MWAGIDMHAFNMAERQLFTRRSFIFIGYTVQDRETMVDTLLTWTTNGGHTRHQLQFVSRTHTVQNLFVFLPKINLCNPLLKKLLTATLYQPEPWKTDSPLWCHKGHRYLPLGWLVAPPGRCHLLHPPSPPSFYFLLLLPCGRLNKALYLAGGCKQRAKYAIFWRVISI